MTDATFAYPIADRRYLNITDRRTLQRRFCPKFNGSHQLQRHCRSQMPGSFAAVLAFLRAARASVFEVTATAIPGLADIATCAALARRLGVRSRRRELDVSG